MRKYFNHDWFLITLLAIYTLTPNDQVHIYLVKWRRNWFLALFIFLAFASAFWSLGFIVTLFRALELLFASLIASFIGTRYGPRQMLESLFWFGAI